MLALWCLQKLLNSARTHLANDAKAAKKKGGESQFFELVNAYMKALQLDGIVGLYRCLNVSCAGIIV